MPEKRKLIISILAATLLALAVVVLGAYVRLSDAGLGCPDWPGCYGGLGAPESAAAQAQAQARFPGRAVVVEKAWKEMVHRYLAGGLGLLIVLIAVLSWRRRHMPGQRLVLPGFLVALVCFQALLGMWTVTERLQPLVVVAHLLGGFSLLALLWWYALRQGPLLGAASALPQLAGNAGRLRPWALAGLLLVAAQVLLGGWTSANYAALACPDLPTCHGRWWPDADFRDGFTLWRSTSGDFEGGVLEGRARVAIQLTHRVGAVVTFLYIGVLGLALVFFARGGALKLMGGVILGMLTVQVTLGVGNVLLGLPLGLAVAHNAGAALLVLSLVTLLHRLWPPRVSF